MLENALVNKKLCVLYAQNELLVTYLFSKISWSDRFKYSVGMLMRFVQNFVCISNMLIMLYLQIKDIMTIGRKKDEFILLYKSIELIICVDCAFVVRLEKVLKTIDVHNFLLLFGKIW